MGLTPEDVVCGLSATVLLTALEQSSYWAYPILAPRWSHIPYRCLHPNSLSWPPVWFLMMYVSVVGSDLRSYSRVGVLVQKCHHTSGATGAWCMEAPPRPGCRGRWEITFPTDTLAGDFGTLYPPKVSTVTLRADCRVCLFSQAPSCSGSGTGVWEWWGEGGILQREAQEGTSACSHTQPYLCKWTA